MSMTPAQSDRLRRLIVQLSDGSLDDAGWSELDALLADSPEAQDIYLDHLTHEALLQREYAESSAVQAPPVSEVGLCIAAFAGSVAAAVLLTGAVVAIYMLSATPPTRSDAPKPNAPIVATVIDTAGTLMVDDDIAVAGSEYSPGAYAIEAGAAELQLTSGANVKLNGRARITLRSDMDVVLEHGLAAFHCPPSAHGFTVTMPDGARVVDLGTSFSIDVREDGSSAVWVTSGRVRIERDGAPPSILTAGRMHTRTADGRWRTDDTAHPLAVTDGLALRLVADSDLELDESGGVIRWGGSDGSLTAAQEEPAKRPRLIPGALAGLPVVRFDGDLLRVDTLDRPDDLTVLAVVRPVNRPQPEGQIFHCGPVPVLVLGLTDTWRARTFSGPRVRAAQAVGSVATPNTPVITGMMLDSSSAQLSLIVDDKRWDAEASTPRVSTDMASSIGSHPSGVSSFVGDVAELIVFTRALTGDEIDALRTQLRERYGLADSTETNASTAD